MAGAAVAAVGAACPLWAVSSSPPAQKRWNVLFVAVDDLRPQLGGKHNNYEGATRAPLIVATPGQKSRGTKCDALVEFVDMYPSLAQICGLPAPVDTEGKSFQPLLDNPQGTIKDAGCSWYPKGGYQGVALRTDRWRFVQWSKKGEPDVYELYDHRRDPQENQNLAGRPEYAATIKELSARLCAKLGNRP